MTFVEVHGVLGLEAVHTWRGAIALNTQTGFPRVELDRITGLHSLPEADDNREAATGRIGEIGYLSLPRGKTITYEGRIVGASLHQLRAHGTLLRAYFADRTTAHKMSIASPLGSVAFWYDARVLAFDMDDDQTFSTWASPSPYQRPFVLSLRQLDPRYYRDQSPAAYSGNSGETVTVSYGEGNAVTPPYWRIFGPVTDGDVTLERTDNPDARQVVFRDLTIANGQVFRFNHINRMLKRESDNADFTDKLDFAATTWWDPATTDLNPGVTHIRATGAPWSFHFWPAVW
jgi:hypothetical protein